MAERRGTVGDEPYTPPAPDGLGAAAGVKPEAITDDGLFYLVLEEFVAGGYRHSPGQVLDAATFRKYAPKTEISRRDNGFLVPVTAEEYPMRMEELKRRFSEPAPAGAAP